MDNIVRTAMSALDAELSRLRKRVADLEAENARLANDLDIAERFADDMRCDVHDIAEAVLRYLPRTVGDPPWTITTPAPRPSADHSFDATVQRTRGRRDIPRRPSANFSKLRYTPTEAEALWSAIQARADLNHHQLRGLRIELRKRAPGWNS